MLHWPAKASKLGFLSSLTINIKFLIDRVPSCPSFEIWDYGPMELKGSKLGFLSLFTINVKFLIDRVPSCNTFEIWDFGRIGE
jgi:uncharacterized protein YbbK (DUF523 family)